MIKNDCPCTKIECVRHGDCDACKEHHKDNAPYCERDESVKK